MLHTSGTTSRPKIVPLAHVNVTASAYHIGCTLALTPSDVCLNIMPLFHIHGLIAATLSSIAAGASVFCTPGFNALKFFSWFEDAHPTWYTAVPTMHQAILTRADRNMETIRKGRLRFIRSSSSSLPPQVMEALEATFGVPVIESYGMTEASHQMASNPLQRLRPRFSGCVGLAAGPDVGIMDEAGALLPSGALGEIVIRGRNVTLGYESNPEANAKAFTNGWFRTGDQGTIDAAGYLRLTGRLKELINRGGEKNQPIGGRYCDYGSPGGGTSRHLRHAARHAGRGCCSRRGAARRRLAMSANCAPLFRRFARGGLQSITAQDPVPGGNPQGCHRQAATHRPGTKAGLGGMKVAIFGAGAIGGYLAVKLHQAGAQISVIARGPHLVAIQANGLTLRSEGESVTVRMPCTDKTEEVGAQDYVVVQH